MKEQSFVIKGGYHLKGEIDVRGSKNAALPILAATILSEEPSIIENVPLIEDVFRMIEILESMGARVDWIEKRSIKIDTKNLDPAKIDYNLVGKLRASILFIGSALARFKKFTTKSPGGCDIGSRTLEPHFNAFKSLGVKIKEVDDKYIFEAGEVKNTIVVLDEFSPTATENILLFAALSKKEIEINLCATEPHVQDLCFFLQKMGVNIIGIKSNSLKINGAKKLKGARHKIISDYIEIGTFISLAASTKSKITIKNIIPEHLTSILAMAKRFGIMFELKKNSLKILSYNKLRAVSKVLVLPYPGFPADLQAPFGVLATQAEGTTLIQDTLFDGRFKYINELNKMGGNCIIMDPHRALIIGPTPLYGNTIESFDLRAGATSIIAGLLAEGETIINNIYQVDRGYEKIDERLQKLGARIKRI
ncbi:MAG: UDP-N-acetylglucosamine 1-carboxyvinyltransferase [Patescibacteria group bacterium]